MSIKKISFGGQQVTYCIGENFEEIAKFNSLLKTIFIIDKVVFDFHSNKFENLITISIEGKEYNKTQATVDAIISQMLNLNVDKSWMIVAVGGGVITDMVGYIASIYKRGIKLGLIPTTILGMTDAAIGGKNGVNVGIYKNMVGTMHRPSYILFDFSFLNTLPKSEWVNGFAEIIKHACIKDAIMFSELEKNNIDFYINNNAEIAKLIENNIDIKTTIVLKDEFENEERFLLNFGHTFGHAIENTNNLPHGHAVSLGMVIAAKISEEMNGLEPEDKFKLINLLEQYELPVSFTINLQSAFEVLQKDKKADGDSINFVLLNKIGDATVKKIPFVMLADMVDQIL